MAQDTGTVDAKEAKVDQVKVEPLNTASPKNPETPKEPTNTEQEQVAEFAGASGIDGPLNKKKLDAGQPEFRPNPTDAAEAENAEKKGPELSAEELSSLPQEPEKPQAAQQGQNEGPKKEGPDLKFTSDAPPLSISEENMKKINEHWGLNQISPALSETLQNCVIKPNKETGGLTFNLANKHKIEWVPEYAGIKGFVGVVGRKKLDDLDAKMIIATLASQGNTKVNLHGDRESKEKMWLEAMRQGLTVSNFQPLPSDDPNSVYQKWLREAPDTISGASQTPQEENAADKPDIEQPAKEAAAETPKSEESKPQDVAVEEPKAEENKPAEVKAEEPKVDENKPAEVKAEEPKAEESKPAEAKAEEPKVEDKKPEEAKPVEPEAKAEEKPSIASSAFAKKPGDETTPEAKEEAKVEKPAADKPAEEKPAAKDAAKSSFIGDKADKKDEAPKPTPPATPKNETLEETLDRRIKQAKNPEVEAALKTLRAEYKSGKLTLDDFDKEVVQKRLGGNGALSVSKVNQAINHVATKPENKGIVLPTVTEQKPQAQKPRINQPGSKGP